MKRILLLTALLIPLSRTDTIAYNDTLEGYYRKNIERIIHPSLEQKILNGPSEDFSCFLKTIKQLSVKIFLHMGSSKSAVFEGISEKNRKRLV